MTYGQRSKFGRSNFRSPRGRISSFRGRGRGGGSDSYYNSSNRDSFSDKSNFRSSSFQSSSYRGNHDHFDSRGSRSRFSGERYSNSRGRRDEEPSYHRRDIRETASGSYGREHLRRSDSESDRKRMRSDIGSSFKEGFSPRRSYDELEHSSRSYSSNSSPYRTDSSPYSGKSHSKEFNDFKRPLPPDRTSYSSVRPTRGARGRGSSSTRIVPRRIPKTPAPSYLKRSSVVSRLKTTSRLQLILRKKKQLRIMR